MYKLQIISNYLKSIIEYVNVKVYNKVRVQLKFHEIADL